MIKLKITYDGTDYFISPDDKEGIDPDTSTLVFWAGALLTSSDIIIKSDSPFGGYVAARKGGFTLSPNVLPFPAPKKVAVKIWQDSTILVEGNAILENVLDSSVSYELYEPEYAQNALDVPTASESKILDSNGVIVEGAVIPLYFGDVTLRSNSHLLARKELKSGDPANSARFYDSGLDTSLVVFDDAVEITSNVTTSTDEFIMEPKPIGEIRAHGRNTTYSTLNDLFSWGATKLGLSLNTTNARATSPELSFFLTEQERVIDVLNKLSVAYAHLFYIREGVLYLVDMLLFGTTHELTENDITEHSSSYKYDKPRDSIISTWVVSNPTTNNAGYPLQLDISKSQTVLLESTTGASRRIENYYHEVEVSGGELVNTEAISNLKNIGTIQQRPSAKIELTFAQDISPGDKLTYTDTTLLDDTNIIFFARELQFNMQQDAKQVIGDGIFFQSIATPTTGQSEHIESGVLKGQSRFRFGVTVDQTNAADADYTTLKAALDALTSGGRIFIRNGTYDLNNYDLGNLPWELEGQTQDGVIIQKSVDDANPLFDLTTNDKRVVFKNLTLKSDGHTTAHEMIDVTGAPDCDLIFDSCVIESDQTRAIDATNKSLTIRNCTTLSKILIRHLTTSTSFETTVKIFNNTLVQVAGAESLSNPVIGLGGAHNTRYATIDGNNFSNVVDGSVNITNGLATVINNKIINILPTAGPANSDRVSIRVQTSEQAIITGNKISLDEPANTRVMGFLAIWVANSGNLETSIIAGNKITLKLELENTWGRNIEGVTLASTDSCIVKENTINIDVDTYTTPTAKAPNGVHISGSSDNVQAISNFLTNTRASGTAGDAILVDSGANDCAVKDNRNLAGFTNVLTDNGTNTKILDNI